MYTIRLIPDTLILNSLPGIPYSPSLDQFIRAACTVQSMSVDSVLCSFCRIIYALRIGATARPQRERFQA